jgi:hypothetical protein
LNSSSAGEGSPRWIAWSDANSTQGERFNGCSDAEGSAPGEARSDFSVIFDFHFSISFLCIGLLLLRSLEQNSENWAPNGQQIVARWRR